jgi:hypothetical protein
MDRRLLLLLCQLLPLPLLLGQILPLPLLRRLLPLLLHPPLRLCKGTREKAAIAATIWLLAQEQV